MSKGSWNAQRGCFEPVVDQILCSPSAGLQGQPTHDGTLNSTSNNWMENTPQPSPVDNQTMYSSSRDFYHSIDKLRSLTEVMSAQLDALSTCAPAMGHQCLVALRNQERDLVQMSLNLASLIYNVSSSEEAQTGSPKPP
jgi:hypothetical protein